jgi:peptide/nickel transport system ATP-binding protein
MQSLLEIRNLHKRFLVGLVRKRTVHAVNGVDVAIDQGETVGLVGESGSGKTTLARCALRLIKPTAGAVLFDGVDLASLSPSALRAKRREFQMVFQDPFASLNPRMTLRDVLSEPFAVQGIGTRREREKHIHRLLEYVALDESVLGHGPASLSGGQQQRAGIARALALEPRLLIADEPVSALDASVQAQILNLLASLQQQFRLTLVLVSHSLPVVRHLCSRVAVMYSGRIVEDAPAEGFFAAPKHPYSDFLVRCAPLFRQPDTPGTAVVRTVSGDPPSPDCPPAGCAFHPRCPHASARCAAQTPALSPIDGGAKVACFLYNGNQAFI